MTRLLVHAAVWLIVAVVFVPLTVAMAVADRRERRRLAHDFAHDLEDEQVDWRSIPRVETEFRLPGASREDSDALKAKYEGVPSQ